MKFTTLLLLILWSLNVNAQSGIQWTAGMNIAANSFGNNHPRVVLNRNDQPVVIWGRGNDASVFCSYWNGTSFSNPIKLSAQLTIATASWMGPDIASHGDTIYVVMKEIPEGEINKNLYIVHSFDGAKTFSNPIRVDQIGDSISRFPTVTTDALGNPIVAFMKFNKTFGESRWVVCKSTDFGNSFSKDVLASGFGSSSSICDCCPAVVVSQKDQCAMIYRDNNNNIRDTWMGVSNDNANTFTNGCNVDRNKWFIQNCPASGPDAVIIGDNVYSVFMNGSQGKNLTYFSNSSLSKVSLISSKNLTLAISNLNGQNYPRIASYGNSVAVVWTQDVNGKAQLPLLFSKDISKGLTTNYDTVDLDNITNTDVAMNSKEIYVVWQDDNSRTIKFRSGNYASIPTNISEEKKLNHIEIFSNFINNSLMINSDSKESEVNVCGLDGITLFSATGKNSYELSTLNWPTGIYIVSIQNENKRLFKKFIKM
ncbi:MAG: T9SS type A sorting domain-containing protein [Saprospiraceae bacterium]